MQYNGTLTLNRDAVLQAGSTDRTTFGGKITGTGGLNIVSPFGAGRRVVLDRSSGVSNDFAGEVLIGTNAILQLGVTTSIGNRNLPDATVEIVAEGPTGEMEEFVREVRKGPPMAWVERLEIHEITATNRYLTFMIEGL